MSTHGGSDQHGDDDEHDVGGYSAHSDHEEGGHGEPWLVSYADMMTLLFGFFVILYAFASAKNEDETDILKIKRELATYFGGAYINPIAPVEKEVEKFLAENPELKKDIMVISDPDGMKITLTSQVLFEKGSAEISPSGLPIVKKMVKSIGASGNKKFKIKIEGYTDSIPTRTARYASNWELSAARAIAFLNIFEQAGYDPEYLYAAGYGSTHPLFPNTDAEGNPIPENQAKNRRVVVRIYPADEAKPTVGITDLFPRGGPSSEPSTSPGGVSGGGAPAGH